MIASEHSLHSSQREALLEHLFAGAVMRCLWLKGIRQVDFLKPQVDDGGYDLVLEVSSVIRHIQMKSAFHRAKTAKVPINIALANKPGGCVIWTYFELNTLEFTEFLWFGGQPGERLPDLSGYKTGKHTKGNAEGIKAERRNIRDIPKSKFERLSNIDQVVAHLFGV